VFLTEYHEDGLAVYMTEKISLKKNAENRKKVFEKVQKEKSDDTVKKNN
jgi:hypothetical protein